MILNAFKPWLTKVQSVPRAPDVTYTNNSGRTMIFIAYMSFSVSVAGGSAYVTGAVNGVNLGRVGLELSPVTIMYDSLILFVPPGGTYSFSYTQNNGSVLLQNKYEVT